MNKSFGEYLLELRLAKGWTQQQLADVLGVTNKTVSKWERNEGYPSIDMLLSLSKLFNVSVDVLLNGGSHSNLDNSMEILLQGWNHKKIVMISNLILVIGTIVFFGIYHSTRNGVLSFFVFLLFASISLFLLFYKQEKFVFLTKEKRNARDYLLWGLSFLCSFSLMLPCLMSRVIAMIVLDKSKLTYVTYDVYLSFGDYLFTWFPLGLGIALVFIMGIKVLLDGSFESIKAKKKQLILGIGSCLLVIAVIFASAYSFTRKSNFEYESFKTNYKNVVKVFGGEMYNTTLMNSHFADKKRYEQYVDLIACIDGVNVLVYRPSAQDIANRIKIMNWFVLFMSIGSGYYLFYKKKEKVDENEDA